MNQFTYKENAKMQLGKLIPETIGTLQIPWLFRAMENVQGGGPESPLDFENSNEWPESLCLKGRDTNLWLCFFFF